MAEQCALKPGWLADDLKAASERVASGFADPRIEPMREVMKVALCALAAVNRDPTYKPNPNMQKDIDMAITGLQSGITMSR